MKSGLRAPCSRLPTSGKKGRPKKAIPKISFEALAEMVGTTVSRVGFFMKKFRKLGFIDYNGELKINNSLLNVVLHDQFVTMATDPPHGGKVKWKDI